MEITKHVHAIKIPFQVKTDAGILERFVYSYLINGNEICLIDSGVSSSKEIIFNYMDKIGLRPDDISLMILTHSHPDHIGSAKSIQEKSNCEIAAHQGEIPWIEDVELQEKERPVPNFHSLVEGSVNVNMNLADGDLIDLGGDITLKVIHTPGHSKGSISIFIEEECVLFTGDAVPIKGDLPIYDDFNESIRSVDKLKRIEGINVLLASWDDPQEGIHAYDSMDEGLDYLQNINESVYKINSNNDGLNEIELCMKVLEDLGLPAVAANPIVAKSFQSNLNVLEK
ncbi:MAG: MBL fold metallo-hydrolase [Methanobacterium sp.]|uniref:MBL fold metallo-hydrolase n=1 Tax=Methanobacterium sp. TaxID=2164 RepID=UPI003D646EB0|nr:MBL fold metallo-hydrolase [Methanobacterium sp.]